MPMFATKTGNAFLITTPEGAFLDPRWTTRFLEGLHRQGKSVALEHVVSEGGSRAFVRTRSKSNIQSYLRTRFGPVGKEQADDWLFLSREEEASIRALHMDDQALLPTAGYSAREVAKQWSLLRKQMHGGAGLRAVGVRVILQPAQPTWREEFKKRLTPGNASGGIAGWFRASTTKEHSADVDPKLVAAKASGRGFCIEVQVIVIYKAGPAEKREANAALDRVTRRLVDLLGGNEIWNASATKDVSGRKVSERNGGRHRTVEPRELLTPDVPKGATRFAVSPREAAPLWPVSQALPSPAPVNVLLSPQTAPEPEPPVPEVAESPATSVATDAQVNDDDVRADNGGSVDGPPVQPAVSIPTPIRSSDEKRATLHSARPPERSITRMRREDIPIRGKSREGSGAAKRSVVAARARTSAARDHGLSERDLLIFNQLGDAPLGAAQDVACIYGWSPTTCYESLRILKEAGLVASTTLNMAGAPEERFWIPDDQWGRVMVDRPLPHTASMVQWLWLNRQLVAAVYRLVGMAAQAAPDRSLRFLRWLRSRPFEVVAQFGDGWMLISWSGIWEDREHLDGRLSKCVEEVGQHWGRSLGTHQPGRIAFVVPHGWQAERVWRTMAGSAWKDSYAVYNLDEDTLTGDLDLRSSSGQVPSGIRDDPSPPRATVARWIGFLVHDTAGHMMRLLFAIEQHPGSTPSFLQHLTGINGKNVKAGLTESVKRGLIYRTSDGGYACTSRSLAMAARRDRVWLGLPGRRFGPDKLANHSRQYRKHEADVRRVLGKFVSAGCSVAPGWQAVDGRFEPDGVVWMDQGPCGPGWHYVVHAGRAKRESSVDSVLRKAWSETRTDRYPILVVCSNAQMEEVCWRLGGERRMLTATMSRIRSRPVAGRDGTCWLPVRRAGTGSHRTQTVNPREEVYAGKH